MTHRSLLFIALVVLALSFSAGNIQAEDLEAWPLESNQIDGTGDGKDIYYAFTAGPGMVIARIEATIPAGAAGSRVTVEFLDESLKSLAIATVGEAVDRGRDRVEEALRKTVVELLGGVAETPAAPATKKAVRIKVDEQRTVILRVHASAGVSAYTVRLEGPIVFGDLEGTAEGEASDASDETAQTTTEEVPETATEEVPETATEEVPETATEEVPETATEETEVLFEEEAETGTEQPAEPQPAEVKPPIRIPGRKVPAPDPDTTTTPPAQTKGPIKIPGKTGASKVSDGTKGPIKIPGKTGAAKVPDPTKPVIQKKKATPTKVPKPGLVIRKLERKAQ